MKEDTAFYQLVEKDFSFDNTWSVIGKKEYIDYIEKNITSQDNDISSIIHYSSRNLERKDFKWPIEVGSVQFLLGIFPKDKKIRIASKQLSQELPLMSECIDLADSELLKVRDHTLLISAIPVESSPSVIEFISNKFDLPLFNEDEFIEVHQHSTYLSKKLVTHISKYKQSLFEKISDYALDLTANFVLVRVHLLKFLAILPNLEHDKKGEEVKRIFIESLRHLISDSHIASSKKLKGIRRGLPVFYIWTSQVALRVSELMPTKLLTQVIRVSTKLMAQRFIAGENIEGARKALDELLESRRDATIDQLGELVVSEYEADKYTEKVMDIIIGLGRRHDKGARNGAGVNRAHVSIKVSALCHDFKAQDFKYTYSQTSPRLVKILLLAKEHDVFVNIDAEDYHYRDTVFKVYEEVLLSTASLGDFNQTGIVLQAYLRDAYLHLLDIIKLANQRSLLMPIRLVKGAYWDAETIEGQAHNFLPPQFLNKEETDIHFRQLIFKILENTNDVQLTIASHNIQDHCFAQSLRDKKFMMSPPIEHQCLHMTYEALSVGLSKMNWPTRNYIPIGDLLVGMGYLVRRIMENSSQVNILTIMRSHKKKLETRVPTQAFRIKKNKKAIEYDDAVSSITKSFRNTYPLRTYKKEHLRRMHEQNVKDLSFVEGGGLFYNDGNEKILCSSKPALCLGQVRFDNESDVSNKIQVLFEGFQKKSWKKSLNIQRFGVLLNLADLLLLRREEFASLIMLEAGKTVDEALADVDEAIDFINFYVRNQLDLEKEEIYLAKGVVGVIAPWNFPLAIACGMTIAPLCAGNSVILKPAEQTPLIAKRFVDLCYEAGVPKNILQLSLGEAVVGQAIVKHELIVGVVFTGSKIVGESIYKQVSSEFTSLKYSYSPIPKFAITEMGGKNAIIITNNSELDETISGVIYSAFAHAGQKCSAASRIIIDEKIKKAFIDRFRRAVSDLKVGGAFDYSTMINPLISKKESERVKAMGREAAREAQELGGRVILDYSQKEYTGFCVGPSVFELPSEVTLKSETIASKEVFGPLIHIISYESIDEAIHIFNSTDYALTGGLFCQSQDDIDYIVPKLEVGNIYINRPSTGARVGIEPFGGFKMSGTGPKAGGRNYLQSFNRIQYFKGDSENKNKFEEEEFDTQKSVHPSKLTQERRIYNTKKLIQKLLEQFEVYLGNISEEGKNKLSELVRALEEKDFHLQDKEFSNTTIPGQMSFDMKNLFFSRGLFVDMGEKVQIQSLFEFLINLAIGNGVHIITTNKKNYTAWKEIVELAYRSSFSEYNVCASLHSRVSLENLLREESYEFVFFSNTQTDYDLRKIIFQRDFKTHLVKVYSSDAGGTTQGIERYTKTRSFAVNTMRYGAPLDLAL